MRTLLAITIAILSCSNSLAQLSDNKIQLIQEKVKPLEKQDGFYYSTLRYILNTPRFTEGFAVKKIESPKKEQDCQYYDFIMDNALIKHTKIKRKSKCFCKDNILYIESKDKKGLYTKAVLAGYYALLSCHPEKYDISIHQDINISGAYITRMAENENGTIMNLATQEVFDLNSANLKKILKRYEVLYNQYAEEPKQGDFEIMLDYLIKLNKKMMLLYTK